LPLTLPQPSQSTRNAESAGQRANTARALLHSFDSPMREVEASLSRLASTGAPVLLCGERGTGKGIIARKLHGEGASGPFVPVDCKAIPGPLLESVIFGHLRRLASGASRVCPGRVAQAEGGTLLIDEVAALSKALQARLLILLEEGRYQVTGAEAPDKASLRVVLTTSRDLRAEVQAGRFRDDLYQLLHRSCVTLSPLRERLGDVWILFEQLWRAQGQARGASLEVMKALQQHSWPGNLGELASLAERLSTLARGERLELSDLPPSMRGSEVRLEVVSQEVLAEAERESERRLQDRSIRAQAILPAQLLRSVPAAVPQASPLEPPAVLGWGRVASHLPVDLPALVRQLEELFVDAALDEASGNKALAARLLGLQRTTLTEKLRRRRK